MDDENICKHLLLLLQVDDDLLLALVKLAVNLLPYPYSKRLLKDTDDGIETSDGLDPSLGETE